MNRKELMLQSQSVTQIATDLIKNTNTPSFTVIFMQQFTNSIITTGGLIDAICMDYASVNTPKRLNTAIEELSYPYYTNVVSGFCHKCNFSQSFFRTK